MEKEDEVEVETENEDGTCKLLRIPVINVSVSKENEVNCAGGVIQWIG